jgi:predicted enzyme related to lactoylglutathione lyase
MTAGSDGIGGVISSAGDDNSLGVKLIVEVDDVLESVCYAEELGGHIIALPHEITSEGRRVSVASFNDPEGDRVVLSNESHTFASAHDLRV